MRACRWRGWPWLGAAPIPAITSAIVGASRPEQLADLLPAASNDLAADVKAHLDELTAEYRMGDDPR